MLWEEVGDKKAFGLLPGNRTKDSEKIELKFRLENKECNSDEKV